MDTVELLSSQDQLGHFHTQIDELLSRDRLDQAKQLLQDALDQYPDDPALHYFAAVMAWKLDDVESALESTERVISLNPEAYAARLLRADILQSEEQIVEAEAIYIDVIRDYPNDGDAWAAYAFLMLITLNLEKARQLCKEALRLEPESRSALETSILLSIVEGNRKEADAHLGTLLKENPERASTAWTLIRLLHAKGDNRAALRVAQELLSSFPQNSDLVDVVLDLKLQTHWSMQPLWPMIRFGWGGSIGIWLAIMTTLHVLPRGNWTLPLVVLFLGYVAYSWIWPRVLIRLLKR